jgi:hypothetical protein
VDWRAVISAAVLLAGCVGSNDASPPDQSEPVQSTEPAAGATASVLVRLTDAPRYVEGFDAGVRVTAGDAVHERFLKDFESTGEGFDTEWSTRFDVPAGGVILEGDMAFGEQGPPTEHPAFGATACTTFVNVEPDSTTTVFLDWDTRCLIRRSS